MVHAGVRQWFAPKSSSCPSQAQYGGTCQIPPRSPIAWHANGSYGTSNGVPSELPPIDRVKSKSWGSTTLPPFVMASQTFSNLGNCPKRKAAEDHPCHDSRGNTDDQHIHFVRPLVHPVTTPRLAQRCVQEPPALFLCFRNPPLRPHIIVFF